MNRRESSTPELKSLQDIQMMREAGKLVYQALQIAKSMAAPGVKTADINAAVEEFYQKTGAQSLFKGYCPGEGYTPSPAVTCLSLNEQVVHGIPGNRTLKDGDLLKIDTACRLNGWCADSAITLPIGVVRAERLRLIKVAEEVLAMAIEEMSRRRWWSEVASRMERHAKMAGFSVVESYVGHGIGRSMHETPQVPNFVAKDYHRRGDFRIEPGLVLAVEPMINMHRPEVEVLADNWTVVTKDGMPSVHVEHTLAVTHQGIVVITAAPDDPRGIVPQGDEKTETQK